MSGSWKLGSSPFSSSLQTFSEFSICTYSMNFFRFAWIREKRSVNIPKFREKPQGERAHPEIPGKIGITGLNSSGMGWKSKWKFQLGFLDHPMGIQAGGPSPLSQILGLEFSLPQAGIPKDLPQIPKLLGFFPVFPWFDEVIVKFRDSGNCRGRNGSGGKIPAPTFPNFQTFHWRIFLGRVYSNLILQSHPPLEKILENMTQQKYQEPREKFGKSSKEMEKLKPDFISKEKIPIPTFPALIPEGKIHF